ncbi:MAG: hypothetical protein GY866_41665 [Proteobacteria bacterium]|nr:hypothetical protein [Pseudomonadota bacterium]
MSQRKFTIAAIFLVAILVLGLFSTWFFWTYTVRRLSEEAMEQAIIVARSINDKRLEKLQGNSTDLNSPDYFRIKEQLTQVRQAHRTCRFLYLMGRKSDGTVFFFLDSQAPDSEDYAPPGLIYEEVSEEYLFTFDTGKRRTVGPIKDRWGTFMTSLVPIYSQETHELIAVLGMDINANDWKEKTISQCLLPVSLTISIILLTVLLLMINRNRRTVKMQYNEKSRFAMELQQSLQHVKKLQGLLPICASCKKIRDSKGYWNRIESYIEKHSEAQFSHGLCEECSDELYGKEAWYEKVRKKRESRP